jgi:glycosyltransferase involved in cell wall biosynthesis
MKTIVVIPAYNEAEHLAAVVKAVLAVVDTVVVVDDCSKDQTSQVARQAGAHVLRFMINRGQGAALRAGTHWALEQGADIIVHFDADGQFRPQDIKPALVPIVKGQADVVFGSRFLDNQTAMPWTKKQVIMPLARLVNRIFFGVRLSDPQSGFRVLSASAATRLNWRQDRMAHCSEILALTHRLGLRVQEVPIKVIYHEYGQKIGGGFKIMADLFLKHLLD